MVVNIVLDGKERQCRSQKYSGDYEEVMHLPKDQDENPELINAMECSVKGWTGGRCQCIGGVLWDFTIALSH